jgi:hypothetical protein
MVLLERCSDQNSGLAYFLLLELESEDFSIVLFPSAQIELVYFGGNSVKNRSQNPKTVYSTQHCVRCVIPFLTPFCTTVFVLAARYNAVSVHQAWSDGGQVLQGSCR